MTKVTMKKPDEFLRTCQIAIDNLPNRPLLISIDGRHGSGKSLSSAFLKAYLLQLSIQSTIIHSDKFFIYGDKYKLVCKEMHHIPKEEDISYTYDLKSFEEHILRPIILFDIDNIMQNKWLNYIIDGKMNDVRSGCATIIEGFASQSGALRELYDITIFVETPLDTCIKLALERDGGKNMDFIERIWRNIENEYFKRECPEANADFIISNIVEESMLLVSERRKL